MHLPRFTASGQQPRDRQDQSTISLHEWPLQYPAINTLEHGQHLHVQSIGSQYDYRVTFSCQLCDV
jgi:hypothetical protein